ncbi:MAG: hypothetical protein ACLQBX_03155 [Candidatus Limnocylindrales bacterium]
MEAAPEPILDAGVECGPAGNWESGRYRLAVSARHLAERREGSATFTRMPSIVRPIVSLVVS